MNNYEKLMALHQKLKKQNPEPQPVQDNNQGMPPTETPPAAPPTE